MRWTRMLSVLDYHTEGEPMRVVVGGVPPLPGKTILEKSDALEAGSRDLLGFVLYEPRGHSSMCGAILVEPTRQDADTGVVFIEPAGCVHMCGHGALAIATMLVETGRVAAREPETEVALETAAGLVTARVRVERGTVLAATIRNVPSFSYLLDGKVDVPGLGAVPFDLAYGGHFYALVPARPLGLELVPSEAPRLIEVGERLRARIEAEIPLVHPERPRAKGLLYVEFYDAPRHPRARFLNAVVVSPLGLDRSPCGTGTSARLANLYARREIRPGEPFVHESLLGTLFEGRIVGVTRVGEYEAVVPEITGRAYLAGMGQLVLTPDDPFPGGFLLGR